MATAKKHKGKKKAPKPEELLLAIASSDGLCHTSERIPVIVMDRNERRRTFILPDKEYEAVLAKRLYDQTCLIAKGAWIKDAMRLVEALCLEGPCRPVFTRVGHYEGGLYFDLGDDTLRVIKITTEGWSVTMECPILFHRSPNVSPMPEPERGGSLAELRPLLNISDADWPVVVVFLLACLNPVGPFPLLILNGQAGAAKSTLARLLQGIVDSTFDPKRGREELFAPPRTPEDLMVFAINSWVLAFDNLSKVPDSLSEALCRLSTGGATVARKLYTNSGIAKMTAQQPVIITCINDVVTAEDLRSRSLFLDLEMLEPDKVVGEAALQERYMAMRPRVMGALLDSVVCALNNFEQTKPLPGNRLADMTRWVLAAEPTTGLPSGAIANALRANRQQAAEDALSSPLAEGIRKLANEGVRLKAEDIRERLMEIGIAEVPNPVALGCKLKSLATELAAVGVLVKKDSRYWIIKRLAA
ncbi:MAG TPA: hypothetical protein VGG64_17890 [Pirellulales bacterium]